MITFAIYDVFLLPILFFQKHSLYDYVRMIITWFQCICYNLLLGIFLNSIWIKSVGSDSRCSSDKCFFTYTISLYVCTSLLISHVAKTYQQTGKLLSVSRVWVSQHHKKNGKNGMAKSSRPQPNPDNPFILLYVWCLPNRWRVWDLYRTDWNIRADLRVCWH